MSAAVTLSRTMEQQRIETAGLPWVATNDDGVSHKVLTEDLRDGVHVSLVQLAPGAGLRVDGGTEIEATVVDGTWSLAAGDLGPGGYARGGDDPMRGNESVGGCTLFVRQRPMQPDAGEPVFQPLTDSDWGQGHGNLRVRPLHNVGTEGTALVLWPDGERFVPHRHFGGEEIFVLSGVFEDEHGRYPAGTWLFSPHMSEHHPFVCEETLIYVKTGHAPPS